MLENFCNENMQGDGSPSHSCALRAEQNHKYNCGAGTSQEQLCGHVNKAKGWLAASDCVSFLSASSLHLCYLNRSFCVWFLGIFFFTLWRWWYVGKKEPTKSLCGSLLTPAHALGVRALLAQHKLHLGVMAGMLKAFNKQMWRELCGFVRYKNELFTLQA